jgi:hypothetical protein
MRQGMAEQDYVVMLTPTGECGSLALAERSDKSFTVKEGKGTGSEKGIFQYVLYVKQHRPQRPGRPSMPPQMGQPPQHSAPPAPPAPDGK